MSQQASSNPFASHSDVTLVYPDLFHGLDETLTHTVRSTMAESIIEDRTPSRDVVARRIELLKQG